MISIFPRNFPSELSFVFFSLLSVCSGLEYDFIIAGGGSGGLTVANRLSELPNISVLVIEAGDFAFNNSVAANIDGFTLGGGTDIDWQYVTTNQTSANDRNIAHQSGKGLGGTSLINGMFYVRAEKAQIDAWEKLGNPGWNWDALFPYYLKSESFDIPTPAQMEAGAAYNISYHNECGLVKVGYPFDLYNGTLHEDVLESWAKLGIPHNIDVNGGNLHGSTVHPITADREKDVGEDAARAYYFPFQERPNLHVLVNTTVNHITWKAGEDVIADGVEVTYQNGTVGTLTATREVILSAGVVRSPAILELSGVGNPQILNKFGIETKVNLPAVGENFVDQPSVVFLYEGETIDAAVHFSTFGLITDVLGAMPSANLSSWADTVSNAIDNAIPASSLILQFEIQYELLKSGVTGAETIISTSRTAIDIATPFIAAPSWVLMPFSRGNVHIVSADPLAYPALNPNYYLVDFDLHLSIAIGRWMRQFWAAEPMASNFTEAFPSFETLPFNATDEEWGAYVKDGFMANQHSLGTAAMMSRELGGVVDPTLLVYGTKNVRVIDGSVIPLQISGHPTATIYALAEKAVDMMKQTIEW